MGDWPTADSEGAVGGVVSDVVAGFVAGRCSRFECNTHGERLLGPVSVPEPELWVSFGSAVLEEVT